MLRDAAQRMRPVSSWRVQPGGECGPGRLGPSWHNDMSPLPPGREYEKDSLIFQASLRSAAEEVKDGCSIPPLLWFGCS